jgi:Transposase, Mutator family
VVTEVLTGLRDRGLDTTRPLLVVLDGAKALRRAVTEVFDHPVIQRCQLHKLRNVTDRLPDAVAATVAKRMRAAYRNPDPLIAQAELEALARTLDRSHPGAAASLPEGLAETLTIGRLGVPPTLARTLRSTDESFKARVCCRPAGTGLASWSGVVDPGAKSRVVGLEALPRSLPLEGPNRRGPSGGGHAPCDQIVIGACSQAASVASPPPAGGKRPRPAR